MLEVLGTAEEVSWDDLVARTAIPPERVSDAVETLLAEGAIRVIQHDAPPAAFALIAKRDPVDARSSIGSPASPAAGELGAASSRDEAARRRPGRDRAS